MKRLTLEAITDPLKKKISGYGADYTPQSIGTVITIQDGVAKVSGLSDVAYMELVMFQNGIKGVAINLEKHEVGVIVLGEYRNIRQGDTVTSTGQLLSIPVGNQFLGRIINPLGEPVDGSNALTSNTRYPLEKIAPGVVLRQAVSTPLQTGIKAIDAMIPIGRGQRELIIGDRNTGKTAIAVDTIINQKDQDVVCIYVAIGQKTSRIAQVVSALEKYGSQQYSIVISAAASDPVSFQYLAPYAGAAMAEYFMDQGRDVLVIYDDLSKHAWAYRQISLSLRRPSGREAYPGDVFYLHSRLLERACRLSEAHGGGSITALPIIETLANDVSAYIPTNVISITDGQIYLESDLFYAGQRPAINVGLSVSRVGSAAQIKAMKKVAGSLRIDLAQYRSLAAFAQFSTDVDDATKKQIDRGSRMVELLKQGQYVPMPVTSQVISIWAGASGYLDDIPLSRVSEFETGFLGMIAKDHAPVVTAITKEKIISDVHAKVLDQAIQSFKADFMNG